MASSALDHLILFVPVDPETKLPRVPTFLKQDFTLTPGGVHADGITSNTLILFADGCYIELISFIDPSKATSHGRVVVEDDGARMEEGIGLWEKVKNVGRMGRESKL